MSQRFDFNPLLKRKGRPGTVKVPCTGDVKGGPAPSRFLAQENGAPGLTSLRYGPRLAIPETTVRELMFQETDGPALSRGPQPAPSLTSRVHPFPTGYKYNGSGVCDVPKKKARHHETCGTWAEPEESIHQDQDN